MKILIPLLLILSGCAHTTADQRAAQMDSLNGIPKFHCNGSRIKLDCIRDYGDFRP